MVVRGISLVIHGENREKHHFLTEAERPTDIFIEQPVEQRAVAKVKHKLPARQPRAAPADRSVGARFGSASSRLVDALALAAPRLPVSLHLLSKFTEKGTGFPSFVIEMHKKRDILCISLLKITGKQREKTHRDGEVRCLRCIVVEILASYVGGIIALRRVCPGQKETPV